jgi:CheY-like chemotaxis protein
MEEEQRVTIAMVDDDEGLTELVRRNLRRSGIRNPMVALRSGQEALDFVFRRGPHQERPPDRELLVLLDINMPGGLDGIEVLRQIKSHPETKSIPVIMLTTTDDPREVNRCYELGCNVYITKPVEPSTFIDAIHRLGLFISVVSLPSMDGRR